MASDDAVLPTLQVGKTRLISLDDSDRRTKAAQTAIATKEAIQTDLGGEDRLSTLERILAEHAALASVVVQDSYARWLQGAEVPLAELGTVQNSFSDPRVEASILS